jgi:hypothetical protein
LTRARGARYQWQVHRLAVILVLLVVAPPVTTWAQEPAPQPAAGNRKDREKRAESAFMAARYEEAADLLESLYADFKRPIYLRNLGRCRQRMKDPDRAITAFEEYLRRGENLSSAEREEVQGYIREMEDLRRKNEAAAAPPPPPPPAPVLTAPPPPVTPAAVTAPPAAVVATSATAPVPAHHDSGKLAGGLLLGTAGLMAAGGGAMLASSWSEFHRGQHLGCPLSSECPTIADRVDTRALWGKVLFGAAAATGIAGGTVLWLSFSGAEPRAANGLTVAVRGRF